MIQSPAQQIAVRRLPYRLVEGARKMVPGKSGHGSQRIEANFLVKMRFDVITNATCQSWRQPTTFGCRCLGDGQAAKCADPWPEVGSDFGPTTPDSGFVERWRNQYAPPPAVATGTYQVDGNVLFIIAAKRPLSYSKIVDKGTPPASLLSLRANTVRAIRSAPSMR
jgi:hypothetical protein